jgi:EAL domain-containing protein (putative c-di-GMP-specific phosphodiesterase class I)
MLELDLGVDHSGTVKSAAVNVEADLARGLRGGEFTLHYQPICGILDGRVVGVEALLRWENAMYGRMTPATYIPVAERSGLIHDLGRWVLSAACEQLASWDRDDLVFPFVSVNVSPVQLQGTAFIDYVDEAIAAAGIEATRVVLEITEGLRIGHIGHARKILEALRSRGVGVAVDDFGTGYSSLTYLQVLPLSKIKIDRSFVANLPSPRNDAAIVQALIGLAHALDLDVVAEGVETEAQRARRVELGCEYIQGWLTCKPTSADELTRRLAARTLWMEDIPDLLTIGHGRALKGH